MEFVSPPPTPRPLPAPVADEPPRLTARTLEGLEWLLARELETVGATDLRIGRRTIEFAAPPGAEKETLYRAVLECRTAIRVLEPLGRFRVDAPEALYRAVQEIAAGIRQPRWWSERPAASRNTVATPPTRWSASRRVAPRSCTLGRFPLGVRSWSTMASFTTWAA